MLFSPGNGTASGSVPQITAASPDRAVATATVVMSSVLVPIQRRPRDSGRIATSSVTQPIRKPTAIPMMTASTIGTLSVTSAQ